MEPSKKHFIDEAIKAEALGFGEFTLKSGRLSPYFFNAGKLYQGRALSVLAKAYAACIKEANFDFDIIFGPAYKGISLGALTAAALYDLYGIDKPFTYNRKEKKDHGEGGVLVGADVTGKKLLVIDDVITAGTAINEVAQLAKAQQATLAGVVVGLDRQEKAQGELSAIQQVEKDFDIAVKSIIQLTDIIDYLGANREDKDILDKIKNYRSNYGIQQ